MSYIIPYKTFIGAWLPKWLLMRTEVSSGAKLCYARLCQFSGADGVCHPSSETLAEELGISVPTVRRHVKELEDLNLIEAKQRGLNMTNSYRFKDHPWHDFRIGDSNQDLTKMSSPDRSQLIAPDQSKMLTLRESVEENQLRDKKTASKEALVVPKKQSGTLEDIISQVGAPSHLQTEAFMNEWKDWIIFKMKNAKCKDWVSVFKRHMRTLSKVSEPIAIETLDKAISGTWAMPYLPKPNQGVGFKNEKGPSEKADIQRQFEERVQRQREFDRKQMEEVRGAQ